MKDVLRWLRSPGDEPHCRNLASIKRLRLQQVAKALCYFEDKECKRGFLNLVSGESVVFFGLIASA